MEKVKSFDVKVNTRYAFLHELGLGVLFVALIGLLFMYIVDLPVKDQSAELRIPYYFWLPKWITDTYKLTLFAFVLGFGLLAIRKNTSGQLKILADRIEIKSKQSLTVLKYSDLKRISFVNKSFWFSPYRIEFVYKNWESLRTRIRSESDFEEVFKSLNANVPKGFELYAVPFETIDFFG